jgi:hypothetical protein
MTKPVMKIDFKEYPEPKEWTSDGGRLHWRAVGEVVVTCSEHGEVIRFRAENYLYKRHPRMHRNASLWEGNHLRQEHGIERGY